MFFLQTHIVQKNFGGDYGVLYVKLLLNEFLVPNVRFYLCMNIFLDALYSDHA